MSKLFTMNPKQIVLCVALVVVILPVLYILEPFVRIRLGLLKFQRIGHLAGDTDAFLRRRQLEASPPRSLYLFAAHDPANKQLLNMYKRHLNIIESRLFTAAMFYWQNILKHTRFWEPLPWAIGNLQRYHLMNHTKKTLSFTDEEHQRGLAALAEMGVGENDWFVCFHARDGAYFRKWRPQYEAHWQRRDFRNCSIENYLPAAEYIAKLGGYAIRMGAFTDQPLPPSDNPRIIDYATKYRSDFMDVYLGANCRFFLGSSSGLNMVPMIFDKPVALANNFQPTNPIFHTYDLFTLRPIRWHADNSTISFKDAVDPQNYAGIFGSVESDVVNKFDFSDDSPEDILDLTKDMIDSLENREPSSEARELQTRYAEEYLSGHLPDYQFTAKVSPRFALKYKHLLFPEDTPKEANG